MIYKTKTHAGRGRRPLPRALLASLILAVPLVGCDTEELLRVEDPEFATPGSLRNEAGLPTLYAGAVGDFQVAYSGSGGDAFLSVVAAFTDEFHTSDTFTTRIATDQREQQPPAVGNTSDAAYNRLQGARRSLADAADAITEFSPQKDKDPRIAELKALEGYTFVALAEAFCAPIPFSATRQGVPGDAGQPLDRDAVFREAVKRFDAALAVSPNSNLAKVGKARALMSLNDYAAAAAAVSGVPTTFEYFIEHSANSGRQNNPIFSLQANGRYSMSDREGGNGLPYRSSNDPRLPWRQDPAGGFDRSVPLFIDLRYPDFGSDVPLGGGVEARLIEAEAALKAGNTTLWLQRLNELRAQVRQLMTARFDRYASFVPGPNNPTPTLDPLTDPGTPAARVDLMFRERAFWLYTQGHRLGDMRRLIRQYGRTQDQVFPVGGYHKGGRYGQDVNFPIPFDEGNNPNYRPEQCNTKQA